MSRRRGKTSLGCLFTLLMIAAVFYFGVNIGEAYWRYLQYRDAMRQEARYRGNLPNAQIQARLKHIADSLGLPPDAGIVTVRREGKQITLEAYYEELIDLPLVKREIHFEPRAVGTF